MTAPSERLVRRIRRDFGRGADDEVIRRLTALAADDSSERIQAAVVLAADGNWARFEHQLRVLELDWRVVLVAGGLAGEDWPARLSAELPPADDGGVAVRPRSRSHGAMPNAPRRDRRNPRRRTGRG